ncbi:MAG: hypothetical protein ABR585_14260 [Gemmatimonadaceae bacterium]
MKPLSSVRRTASTTVLSHKFQTELQVLSIVPQTAVALQVSWNDGGGNTAGQFFTIPAGGTYTIEAPAGKTIDAGLVVSLYAASSVVVDLVGWSP